MFGCPELLFLAPADRYGGPRIEHVVAGTQKQLMPTALAEELQATIDREIPICPLMGIQIVSYTEEGLRVSCPLDRNRNHCGTAFAGSLNTLCTVAGWGSMFLLARRLELPGEIVIHRSAVKYRQPVQTPRIEAFCAAASPEEQLHFLEMYREKQQAKLEYLVEIAGSEVAAVTFRGSYVITAKC